MGKLNSKPIAFIDIETTGLSASEHEVIEFAIIKKVDGKIVLRTEFKIKPDHIERAHPKALEINGYTPEKWEGALSQEEGARRMVEALEGCICAGHNIGFDIGFILATVTR